MRKHRHDINGTIPATSAADADLAPMWWQALSRQAWRTHLKRAAWIAGVVVVVGACVSGYLSHYGWKSCDVDARFSTVCTETHFYAFTVQPRTSVTTIDGDVSARREWHPTGAVWIEGQYNAASGTRTGLWRENYADGTRRFEGNYADDKLVGTETWFYPSGKREWEIGRLNGARDGEERWYHDNGELRRVGTYKNGARDGTFTMFDETGAVTIRGEYKDGALVVGARDDDADVVAIDNVDVEPAFD